MRWQSLPISPNFPKLGPSIGGAGWPHLPFHCFSSRATSSAELSRQTADRGRDFLWQLWLLMSACTWVLSDGLAQDAVGVSAHLGLMGFGDRLDARIAG